VHNTDEVFWPRVTPVRSLGLCSSALDVGSDWTDDVFGSFVCVRICGRHSDA